MLANILFCHSTLGNLLSSFLQRWTPKFQQNVQSSTDATNRKKELVK